MLGFDVGMCCLQISYQCWMIILQQWWWENNFFFFWCAGRWRREAAKKNNQFILNFHSEILPLLRLLRPFYLTRNFRKKQINQQATEVRLMIVFCIQSAFPIPEPSICQGKTYPKDVALNIKVICSPQGSAVLTALGFFFYFGRI